MTFLQKGLIKKVLKGTGMQDCNAKPTPACASPIGTDADGPRCKESWDYASVIGMLMYLMSNSRPNIQYAVHQCARFTHSPRASHEQAILRMCRYLSKGDSRQGVGVQTSSWIGHGLLCGWWLCWTLEDQKWRWPSLSCQVQNRICANVGRLSIDMGLKASVRSCTKYHRGWIHCSANGNEGSTTHKSSSERD